MNNDIHLACPHCGSRKLISRAGTRKIFLDHNGEVIPLLTANFNLDKPIIEESSITYTCSCSWSGTAADSKRLASNC